MMPGKLRYENLSLLTQIIVPFILLLAVLGSGISIGGSQLLQERMGKAIKLRLEHVQTLAYQDFKLQERLLAKHVIEAKLKLPLSEEKLQEYIHTHDKQARLIISDQQLTNLSAPLQDLVSRALDQQEPLVSVVQEKTTQNYYLIACLKLPEQILILQRPLGRPYLDELSDRFQNDFFLFDRAGDLIATSSNAPLQLPELTSRQLISLQAGIPTSIHTNDQQARLFSYTPLPLGNEGLFILGTADSFASVQSLVDSFRHYLLAFICLILLIGIVIYRALLLRIFSPVESVITASRKIIAGERQLRIETEPDSRSQLTQCGVACNQLLAELEATKLSVETAREQSEQAIAIENQNRHLRKINSELEKRNLSLKEQNQEFTALFQVTQAMTSSLDQQQLFERILQALRGRLGCSRALLLIYKPGSECVTAVNGFGFQTSQLKNIQVPLGQGLAGEAALNQQMVYCSDLSKAEEAQHYAEEQIALGSLLAVPMTMQNRLIGVINLHHPKKDGFNSTAQQIAQAIATQAAIAIENARLYEKTKTLSATDELTGLPNRR